MYGTFQLVILAVIIAFVVLVVLAMSSASKRAAKEKEKAEHDPDSRSTRKGFFGVEHKS